MRLFERNTWGHQMRCPRKKIHKKLLPAESFIIDSVGVTRVTPTGRGNSFFIGRLF